MRDRTLVSRCAFEKRVLNDAAGGLAWPTSHPGAVASTGSIATGSKISPNPIHANVAIVDESPKSLVEAPAFCRFLSCSLLPPLSAIAVFRKIK